MMKKVYMKPKIDIVEMEPCEMLTMSLNIDSESKGDYSEDFATKRRKWGNLWEEEK